MAIDGFDKVGLFNYEGETVQEELEAAKYAEEKGFNSVWQAESRLTRDAISVLGAYSQVTDSLTIGSGVVNNWTRNVALMAQTWQTLDQLSGGRAIAGIGAWWDPLASKVGIDRKKPLRALWEYSTVLRRLLDHENVTYDGEIIQVEDIELDMVHAESQPADVPIYLGATGMTAHKMTGELVGKGVCGGIVMNGLIPAEHTERGVRKLKEGVEKQGGSLEDIDRPQIINMVMDDDADVAIDKAKGLAVQYIGQQPHLRKASGVSEDIADQIDDVVGGWPAKQADIEEAKQLLPDDVATSMMAAGTPEDCVQRVHEYVEAGCTEPIVYPQVGDAERIIDVFAEFIEE
jgi:alkanesulfonate monooxygenase SsuD/methylene tetrahydromethanopterin reductase-like flavin-dependent oxidoreductase (luciferase family)